MVRGLGMDDSMVRGLAGIAKMGRRVEAATADATATAKAKCGVSAAQLTIRP
jgi:hypothetical protein